MFVLFFGRVTAATFSRLRCENVSCAAHRTVEAESPQQRPLACSQLFVLVPGRSRPDAVFCIFNASDVLLVLFDVLKVFGIF